MSQPAAGRAGAVGR